MRNECNIIADLLPLYIEGMTTPDTNDFVEEHICNCASCASELEKLRGNAPCFSEIDVSYVDDGASIKRIKRKLRVKKGIAALTASVLTAVVCLAIGIYLYLLNQHPFLIARPSVSEDIQVTTSIEHWEGAYLDQRFLIAFEHLEGKALEIGCEHDYGFDESGNRVKTGYTITVKETVLDIFGVAEYQDKVSLAYAYEVDALPDDFDFIITVVYGDQTVKYSMVDEGLFYNAEK